MSKENTPPEEVVDIQNMLTDKFFSTSNRSPMLSDTVHFTDGSIWEFNGDKWWNPEHVQKIIDSKSAKICSLESMLKRACKFTISSKNTHNITIERVKPTNAPFHFVIKEGFNKFVTKSYESKLEPTYHATQQSKDEFYDETAFTSLLDAFSVAECYVDILEAEKAPG